MVEVLVIGWSSERLKWSHMTVFTVLLNWCFVIIHANKSWTVWGRKFPAVCTSLSSKAWPTAKIRHSYHPESDSKGWILHNELWKKRQGNPSKLQPQTRIWGESTKSIGKLIYSISRLGWMEIPEPPVSCICICIYIIFSKSDFNAGFISSTFQSLKVCFLSSNPFDNVWSLFD